MTLNLNYKNWDFTFILLLLIFIMAALSSCGPQTSEYTISDPKDITYFKDDRTKLCFASLSSYSYGMNQVASISCVPCDSVKHLIK